MPSVRTGIGIWPLYGVVQPSVIDDHGSRRPVPQRSKSAGLREAGEREHAHPRGAQRGDGLGDRLARRGSCPRAGSRSCWSCRRRRDRRSCRAARGTCRRSTRMTTRVAFGAPGELGRAACSASSAFSSQIGFCVVGPVGPSPGLRLCVV